MFLPPDFYWAAFYKNHRDKLSIMKKIILITTLGALFFSGYLFLSKDWSVKNNLDTDGLFRSEILGLAFAVPSPEAVIESVRPSDNEKMPYEHWALTGLNSPRLEATNKETEGKSYEGPSGPISYTGQRIEGMCSTEVFLNKGDYDITVINCEEKISAHGVPYAIIEICSVDTSGDGLIRRIMASVTKPAYAEESCARTIAALAQTKSKKFPGFIVSETWEMKNQPSDKVYRNIDGVAASMAYIR